MQNPNSISDLCSIFMLFTKACPINYLKDIALINSVKLVPIGVIDKNFFDWLNYT